MLPGMEMLVCPNLAVPLELMQHIVQVESGANAFAIGVVDGQLARQPQNMDEALATAQMLESKGYNFSVGISQVNRANLGSHGLDSYRKAFNTCDNLAAGAQILASCYGNANGDWGKAFSCYYSGNFTIGFRDGYVQKVYASINREANRTDASAKSAVPANLAIPLMASATTDRTELASPDGTALRPVVVYASDSPRYRVALRSMAIDTAAAAMMPLVVSAASRSLHAESFLPTDAMTRHSSGNATGQVTTPTKSDPNKQQPALPNTIPPHSATAGTQHARDDGVFEPLVRGPNDPPAPAPTVAQTPANPTFDHADLRKEARDDAFVF